MRRYGGNLSHLKKNEIEKAAFFEMQKAVTFLKKIKK